MVLAALAALRLQFSGAVAPEPCVDTCAPAAFPRKGAGPCAQASSQHVSLAQPLQLGQQARTPLPGPALPVLAQQRPAGSPALQRPREEAPGEQHPDAERAHAAAVALSWAGQADAHVRVTGTRALPAKAEPETARGALGGCEPAASQLAAESAVAGSAFGASVPLWELLRAEIRSGASQELAGQQERPEPDPARRPMNLERAPGRIGFWALLLSCELERAPEATLRYAAAWQRVVSTHNLAELLAEGSSLNFQPVDLVSEFFGKPGNTLATGSAATCASTGVGGWGAGSPGCAHGRRLPPRDWRVLAAGLLLMGGSAAACAVMLFWMVGAKLVPPERAAAWLGTDWGTGPAQAWWVAAWAFAAADTHYCLLLPLTLPVALAFATVNWMAWKLFMLN